MAPTCESFFSIRSFKKYTYFSLRVCLLDEGHVPLLPGLELVEHVGQDGVLVHHSFKENILEGVYKIPYPPPPELVHEVLGSF